VALGLSILLLLILRRRRKVAVRTIYPEHFADRSSVIGAQLSGQRRSRRALADSKKILAARVSAKHGKPSKTGKAVKHQQKPGERAGPSQWEIVKPKQSAESPRTKVADLVAANERLRRQVGEGKNAVKRLENKIAELSTANQQIRQEVAESERAAGQAGPDSADAKKPESQAIISEQAGGDIANRVGELTAANEKLRREAEEYRHAQDRFEQKLGELTAANKQLQQEVAELKKSGSKRRVYTYEDEHRVVNGTKQKLCRKCGEWKAESEFHKNASRSDGLARWCKICKTGAARRSRERRRAPNQ
jgi:prefoldin subunit 5